MLPLFLARQAEWNKWLFVLPVPELTLLLFFINITTEYQAAMCYADADLLVH